MWLQTGKQDPAETVTGIPRRSRAGAPPPSRLMATPMEREPGPLYHLLAPPLIWAPTAMVNRRRRRGIVLDRAFVLCDGLSAGIRRVRAGAARYPALDAIYNWRPSGATPLERFYFGIRNCRALRNRYRLVAQALRAQAITARDVHGEVRVLSVASGSAQAVFEAMDGLDRVSIHCIDRDASAIEYSRELARHYALGSVTWQCCNVLAAGKVAAALAPHIVEIVGLLDYLSDTTAVSLFSRIREAMAPGGRLTTAHVHPNSEREFVTAVADWDPDMLYRTPGELAGLVERAGFAGVDVRTEPLGIHSVALGLRE